MCECAKVHLFEVEFKLNGLIVVPTHKNCGVPLNEKQSEALRKDLLKSWGLEGDEEE